MSKFTPGPWPIPHIARDDIDCNCPYVLAGEYMGSIATISVNNGLCASEGGNDCPPLEVAKANAYLIAAAPEMYEALKLASEALEEGLETEGDLEAEHSKHARAFLKEAHKILAKARGEVEA